MVIVTLEEYRILIHKALDELIPINGLINIVWDYTCPKMLLSDDQLYDMALMSNIYQCLLLGEDSHFIVDTDANECMCERQLDHFDGREMMNSFRSTEFKAMHSDIAALGDRYVGRSFDVEYKDFNQEALALYEAPLISENCIKIIGSVNRRITVDPIIRYKDLVSTSGDLSHDIKRPIISGIDSETGITIISDSKIPSFFVYSREYQQRMKDKRRASALGASSVSTLEEDDDPSNYPECE